MKNLVKSCFLTLGVLALVACQATEQTELDQAKRRQTAVPELEDVAYIASAKRTKHARPMMLTMPAPEPQREIYQNLDDNPIKQVSADPVSTFSVDVDTAAYSNIRRMLNREGRLPPVDAVRIEEMINYFDYSYPLPKGLDQPFSVTTELAPSPWAKGKHLMMVGLKGYQPKLDKRPPANLVFLVDVSGSMQADDKLPLLKKSLALLLQQLGTQDRIALAVYAGAAGTVLESTPASEAAKIRSAIDQLEAGGSTHGSAGLKLAYELAREGFIKDGINRVLIASDGDMNVGISDRDELKQMIERERKSGVALTTLGFGRGNYNYALMEQLADVGNGNAAYIDSMREAQKVLVEEMHSTLLTIANDVKIQVEFNPAAVSEYRLIGYENRMLKREDFNNDKVDAGDIGAGHTVTALYEIALTGSGAEQIPALRYAQKSDLKAASYTGELAHIKLRYKPKQGKPSRLIERPIMRAEVKAKLADASNNLRFAAAVAGFGQLLRGSKYSGEWGYKALAELLAETGADDPHGYRAELRALVNLAAGLEPDEMAR
ncbi:MAG: VWA domain-containing protein [Cellvibrionaceae bacterium]|nr:VWA domain-containing protein [Cellvibrionaceae bacterium]